MPFNQKELQLIEWGASNNKSKEEVKQAIANLRSGITPQAKPKTNVFSDIGSDFKQVGTDIISGVKQRGENIADIRERVQTGETGDISGIYQAGGQLVGSVGDVIGSALKGGVKMALKPSTEQKVKETVAKYGQDFLQNEQVQKGITWYNSLPEETQRNLDATGNYIETLLDITGVGVGAKGVKIAKEGIETGVKAGKELVEQGVEQTFKAGKKILPKSEEIMNKVARLTPTQARKFETIAGKTHGQYLKETGNFGTPDEIVKKEAEKFAQSIKSVDDSLAQLDGTFKDGTIDDVLADLQEKAIATSTKNVKAPYLDRVSELIAKNNTEGLNMSEINEMKRLYERNVKLGYNKMTDAEKIQRATNLDNALREWQIGKAEELGFENLRELNKQTQLSKQLINSLGDQIIGQSGLNNVTLTDWIMLSGGDPTAVGGLLTKKFFSSKKIQSKIAEWLNDTEVKPMVTPKITPSKPTTPPLLKKESGSALPKSSPKSATKSSLKGQGENPPTRKIEPDLSLTGEDAKIQKLSIAKYEANPSKLIKDYIKTNGKVINTDEARKFFKDVGYRGSNSAAVQEASSAVAKDVWKELLRTSKSNDSLIYAGGSGTGKTSAVKNIFANEIADAGAILDGNLSTMKSAQSRIQESVQAGKYPTVVYVYRDPVDSWVNGVIKRMKGNVDEGGRVVPLSVFLQNHKGSYEVIKDLLKNKELGKSFDLKMVDNSLGKNNQSLLSQSKFDTIKYNDSLESELKKLTKNLYEKGTINKTEYEALIK